MKREIKIAVIGGSGLYQMKALKNPREIKIKTPFGDASDKIMTGEISGVPVAFLPRHGKGHRFLPSEIPQRANIYAFKSLGVETVVAVSAVGSLRENMKPKHFVFPDQLVDSTKGRPSTFFGGGVVAHVAFAEPFCGPLRELLCRRASGLGIKSHNGGTLVCIEGPQFSTKAESHFHRKMGYSLVGMTTCPEAKLAREAGLCYAAVCLVTDYDVWKEGEELTPSQVLETMKHNISSVQKLLADAVPEIASAKKTCCCSHATDGALFTDRKAVSPQAAKKLRLIMRGL